MNEEKVRYIKQWLDKAEEDLAVYKLIMEAEYPALSSMGFHLQQATEKFLKAFLEFQSIKFSRTHDIELILEQCAQINSLFSEIDLYNLSDYAVDLRYPGIIQNPSKSELEQAYTAVLEIKQLVLSLIKL